MLKLYVAAVKKIDCDGDHGAVANGGLNVDSRRCYINIVWINHDTKSRKHSIGCKICAECIVNLSFSDDARKQADVHRCGAELEREKLPTIRPCARAVVVRIKHLLIRFEQEQANAQKQGQPTKRALVSARTQFAKKENEKDEGDG